MIVRGQSFKTDVLEISSWSFILKREQMIFLLENMAEWFMFYLFIVRCTEYLLSNS